MIDKRLFRPGGSVSPEQQQWPSLRGAINEAMREEMRRDPGVFQMGEDIAGAPPFGVTTGLVKEFGPERIRDTPCSEVAVVGAAIGAAMGGMRPIVEFQFGDFLSVAIDQLTHQAAMLRYLTGGQVKVPLVIRLPCGGGQGAGSQHSQSLYSWFAHVPGIKVALPSTAKSGEMSRIVPFLKKGAGVVTTRADVKYVVTEYGVAYLHGKNLLERTKALINIAHPKFRPDLIKVAKDRNLLR